MQEICEYLQMPKARSRDLDLKAQSARMTKLRTSLGYTSQRDFAAAMGFEAARWNNFETGYPVSLSAAMQLVKRIHGLTLDWIYSGSPAGLSVEMATKLGALPHLTTTRRESKRGAST